MPSLYELTGRYLNLASLLGDPAVDEREILGALASLDDDIKTKALNTARVIKNLSADVEAIDAEEKRLKERRVATRNRIDGLKRYLQENMEHAGLSTIQDAILTVAIQNNPPSVHVLDERAIPQSYVIPQPPKLDTQGIGKALKAGVEVPGAELVQGRSLRIR